MHAALANLAGMLDALHCGAALIDRAGVLLHINPRLAELLGRDPGALLGRPLAELYDDPDARRVLAERLARFEEASETEFFLPRADGARVPVVAAGRALACAPPLNEYRVITVLDISPLKHAEARLKEQYREVSRLGDVMLDQALELKRYSEKLEERVRERTRELHEANLDSIYMLAVASEARDEDTGAHVRRIQYYSAALARALQTPPAAAEHLGLSAILHDVGKMHVPDRILKKPGPLTADERREMEQHTVVGERILSRAPFFEVARQIARHHHENWDGSGYPDALRGEQIPAAARVVHLADVFDALTSPRVYKAPWPPDEAAAAIVAGRGTQFDPAVVEAFETLFRSGGLRAIHERLAAGG